MLSRLDFATSTEDAASRARALTFVFVGGGYAGIEALAELEALGFAFRTSSDTEVDEELVTRLRTWRLERSQEDAVPAYVVLHDATLRELAALRNLAAKSQTADADGDEPKAKKKKTAEADGDDDAIDEDSEAVEEAVDE